MLLHLSEQLEIPLRERNALLLAAGHAPAYAQRELDAPELGPVRDALDRVLAGHAPNPALVVDRHWGLVAANASADLLTAGAAPHLLEPPVNVLRLSLHPEGVAPRIANLPEWRAHLLDRLGREAVAGGDPALAALHEELAGYPGGGPGGRARPRGGRDRRPAAAPPRRRRARLHQHRDDVRHGRRRHGQRAVDRVVLPRRRGDRGRGARARPLAFCAACTTSTSSSRSTAGSPRRPTWRSGSATATASRSRTATRSGSTRSTSCGPSCATTSSCSARRATSTSTASSRSSRSAAGASRSRSSTGCTSPSSSCATSRTSSGSRTGRA